MPFTTMLALARPIKCIPKPEQQTIRIQGLFHSLQCHTEQSCPRYINCSRVVFDDLVADGEHIAFETRLCVCMLRSNLEQWQFEFSDDFSLLSKLNLPPKSRLAEPMTTCENTPPAWTIIESCVPSARPSGKRSTNNGSWAKIALPTHQLPQVGQVKHFQV